MSSFIWIFTVFFGCLWTLNGTAAQTVKCDYKYRYHWTPGYKSENSTFYKCNLDTRQANYDEKLTGIDGQHMPEHRDIDVKLIANYNNHKLKQFSSIFCQKFPNFEVIEVSNAELKLFDEDSLLNCKNLDQLFLSGNKIQELPDYLLIRNSKLTYLRIDKNLLTTLPDNFLLNQKELEILDLSSNQINFLPSKIFHPLVKLQELLLSHNKLESIDQEWFITLQSLKRLSLRENQILEIPLKCFSSLIELDRLFLYGNRIKTLELDSFDGLRDLESLRLENNDISELPVGIFTPLKRLKVLSLYDNKLTTIHSDSFGIHNHLTKIWLEDNKINAIDPKFIEKTAVSKLNMTGNVCSQIATENRSEIEQNIKECYDNYKPRSLPRTQQYSLFSPANIPAKQNIGCGKSITGHGNIIGGTKISSGDFPWIAALVTPAGKFFCGGTVVSSRKVVTAAHCIQDKKTTERLTASNLLVLLGMHDLNVAIETGRVTHAVYSINVHPDWNTLTQSFDADIAVLILEKEIIFNEHVQPICLPATMLSFKVETIWYGAVVGYGKSEDDTKEHENIPKIIATPIHSNDDCFAANEDLINLSSGRTFCGGSGRGVGVCNGDSGSGLVVSDGNAYYLRGVVSSSLFNSYKACDVDSYAIFTNVLKFVDWINGIPTDRFAVHHKK